MGNRRRDRPKQTMGEQLEDAVAASEGAPREHKEESDGATTAPPRKRDDPPRAKAATTTPANRGRREQPARGRFPAQQPKRVSRDSPAEGGAPDTSVAVEQTAVSSLLEQYREDPDSVSPVLVNLMQLQVLESCNAQFQDAVDEMRHEVRALGSTVNEALAGLRAEIAGASKQTKTTGRPRPQTRGARSGPSAGRARPSRGGTPGTETAQKRGGSGRFGQRTRGPIDAPAKAGPANGRAQPPQRGKRAIHRRIERRKRR